VAGSYVGGADAIMNFTYCMRTAEHPGGADKSAVGTIMDINKLHW
jgi:hypothetical protein